MKDSFTFQDAAQIAFQSLSHARLERIPAVWARLLIAQLRPLSGVVGSAACNKRRGKPHVHVTARYNYCQYYGQTGIYA
jgi:hypothetical protein